jgi:hypothetical protein
VSERSEVSIADAARSNEAGYARILLGDYTGALPLLRDAVIALRGTSSIVEAYASYNLALARFSVGRCDGVVGLLDRSQRIQGHRSEIDALRSRWRSRCSPAASQAATGSEDNDDESDEHGNGRKRGHDK